MSQNPEPVVEEEFATPDDGGVDVVVEYADDAAADDTADEAPEIVPAVVLPVAMDRPIQTVGRRKEAVVRIRLMPAPVSSP